MLYYTILDNKIYCSADNRSALKHYEPLVYQVDGSTKEYNKNYYILKDGVLKRKKCWSLCKQKMINPIISLKLSLLRYKYKLINLINPIFYQLKLILFFIIIASFLSLTFIYLNNIMPKERDWIDILEATSSLFAAITTAIVVCYTIKSFSQQRKQWLNEEYIKREAITLLAFKDLLKEAENGIYWFCNLSKEISYKSIPKVNIPAFDNSKVIKYYEILNKLNNFYNDNQIIFRKHNFNKSMLYFVEIVASLNWYLRRNLGDAKYIIVRQDVHGVTVGLTHYGPILNTFLTGVHLIENPMKHEDDFIKTMSLITEDNADEYAIKYQEIARAKYSELKMDIELLTTYISNGDKDRLKGYQMKFFGSYKDILENNNKKLD